MDAKMKEIAPPLVQQVWEFMQNQLEQAEKKVSTVGTFVSLANGTTINNFCKDHATG